MTEEDNRAEVTVSVDDTFITRPGFGTIAIVYKHGETSLERVETYTTRAAGLAVFPLYTPVGQYLNILFSQANKPEAVKVIYQASDEDPDEALDAALLVDNDFYFVGSPSRVIADQTAIAAWALANDRFHVFTIYDADAITSAETDIFSVIQALTNTRSLGYFSKKGGIEFANTAITVSGTTALVATSTPPALGETVGIWGSIVAALNGTYTVEAVDPGVSFSVTVPTGTSSDVAASKGWSNMNLIDAAVLGVMAPYDAGARSWDMQKLSGVTPDNLSDTEKTYLGNKGANWFTTIGGINVTSGKKKASGKTLGGRYADFVRGIDWLKINIQLDSVELMIAEEGDLGYDADGFQKTQTKFELRMADGINKKALTQIVSGPYVGLDYFVKMPTLGSIPADDKLSRFLDGIEIYGALRNKVQYMSILLTLAV